jgi:hypothetical protein
VVRQLVVGPQCTGEWGWRQQNWEKQRGGASKLGFGDSLCVMRIREVAARGGDARSVGGGCHSAQVAWSVLARRPSAHAQGGNSRWASCPGGLRPDYSGLGRYCRIGLGPMPN